MDAKLQKSATEEKIDIEAIFGQNVFSLEKMKERLSEDAFAAMSSVIEEGGDISKETAGEVANVMKEWALENGATHYSHWFQHFL